MSEEDPFAIKATSSSSDYGVIIKVLKLLFKLVIGLFVLIGKGIKKIAVAAKSAAKKADAAKSEEK